MTETSKRHQAEPRGAPHLSREDLLDLRASLELEEGAALGERAR